MSNRVLPGWGPPERPFGPPQRPLLVADIEYLMDAGLLPTELHFELIKGEVHWMASKGLAHEIMEARLTARLVLLFIAQYWVLPAPTLRLSADTFTEPDFVLLPRQTAIADMDGPAVALVIEVASSSKARDEGFKAALMAQHGVREYWVVDATTCATLVHRGPRDDGSWHSIEQVPPQTPPAPLFAPGTPVDMASDPQ